MGYRAGLKLSFGLSGTEYVPCLLLISISHQGVCNLHLGYFGLVVCVAASGPRPLSRRVRWWRDATLLRGRGVISGLLINCLVMVWGVEGRGVFVLQRDDVCSLLRWSWFSLTESVRNHRSYVVRRALLQRDK